MEYNCYLCNRKVKTNDIFATINTHVENGADDEDGGDIMETLLEEKICSRCCSRFHYLKNIIEEELKKQKEWKEKKATRKRGSANK